MQSTAALLYFVVALCGYTSTLCVTNLTNIRPSLTHNLAGLGLLPDVVPLSPLILPLLRLGITLSFNARSRYGAAAFVPSLTLDRPLFYRERCSPTPNPLDIHFTGGIHMRHHL